MNEDQFSAWLANAFRLIDRERQIIKSSASGLLRALAQVRQLIESELPDESLIRQKAWNQLYPQVLQIMQPYGDGFAAETVVGLQSESSAITGYARRQLELAGVSEPVIPSAVSVPGNVQRVLANTYVGEKSLQSWFGRGDDGLSAYVRSQSRHIDRIVTEGILRGQTTTEIADRIVRQRAQSAGLPPLVSLKAEAAQRIQAEAKTVARTAVQEHSKNIHNQVYNANEDALSGLEWEWVAALDSRTCPTCAPLDGRRWERKADAPSWPLHPNCRCSVVAVDPDEPAAPRMGQQVYTEPVTYKGKTLNQMTKAERDQALSSGLYASKIKGKQGKFYRRAKPVNPSDGNRVRYSDFIARANAETQLEFFGGVPKGTLGKSMKEQRQYVAVRRRDAFNKALERGADSQQALKQALKI